MTSKRASNRRGGEGVRRRVHRSSGGSSGYVWIPEALSNTARGPSALTTRRTRSSFAETYYSASSRVENTASMEPFTNVLDVTR